MSIDTDIHSSNPGSLITLYELDTAIIDTANNGGVVNPNVTSKYYFHNGVDQYGNNITWQDKEYIRLPVEAVGFESTTKGTLPKPTLKISNLFMAITSLIQQKGDLVGARLTRRRTLHRYLDAINFIKGAYLAWKTPSNPNVAISSDGLTATFTGTTLVSVASNSPMSTTKLNGATYYWEVDVVHRGTPVNFQSSFMVGIYQGASAVNLPINPYASTAGRLVFGTNGTKYYTGVQYAYSTTGGFDTEGTTVGIVYDSGSGNLYLFKNGVPLATDLDTITPLPAFTGVPGSLGQINPSLPWYPILAGRGGTDVGATSTLKVNFGATPFKFGPPTNIPGRPASTILPLYGNKLADPSASFPDEIFFLNRKSLENKFTVEYELSTALDVQVVKLPRRQIIANTCLWRYRGETASVQTDGCSYNGVNMDINNNPEFFDYPTNTQINMDYVGPDFCSKKLSACKARFPGQPLPYGGFPGAVTQ